MEKIEFSILLQPTTRIGRVRFNEETSCIYINVKPGYEYDVTLKRCTTPAACLDWIHQVGPDSKTWGREIIADFVQVLFMAIPSSFWSGKA